MTLVIQGMETRDPQSTAPDKASTHNGTKRGLTGDPQSWKVESVLDWCQMGSTDYAHY